MKKQVIVTQIKRELWENKVSFIYTPTIITVLILIMAICAAIYSAGSINGGGIHFNFSENGVPAQTGVTFSNEPPSTGIHPVEPNQHVGNFNIVTSVAKDPDAFNGMVVGVMYANCAMLYLIFSMVLGAYALRCLFDDRKNKDILFWRSMPVSETTNVLVKLGMLLLVAPFIMLVLNLLTALLALLAGLILLVIKGLGFGHLMASVLKGGALIIPFQIFYELVFSLLMSMPIIGFAFFASAFAKKTPFFTFASPAILLLADKILNSMFGINIGVIDALSIYARALVNVKEAFVLQQLFIFNSSMILPLFACLAVGALFIAGAIWLRNNRYEI
jgi:ABC-2 type transport system permease protein